MKCLVYKWKTKREDCLEYFDYSTSKYSKKVFKLTDKCTFVDNSSSVSVIYNLIEPFNSSVSYLYQSNILVKKEDNKFIMLRHPNLYLVARYSSQVVLSDCSTIKLGKIEIVPLFSDIYSLNSQFTLSNPIASDTSVCRICLDTKEDSLISLCNCKGNIKYYHESCLLRWIDVKVSFRSKRINSHNHRFWVKNLKCELCSAELPSLALNSILQVK